MKFKFAAIDQTARVVRGVLRAESHEEARDLLMGEQVYPKQLSPVGDSEPVTWVPRTRVLERARASSPAVAEQVLVGPVEVSLGSLSVVTGGTLVLKKAGGEVLRFASSEREEVRVLGWPVRVLRITMLTGQMYEIRAGLFLTAGWARAVTKALDKAR